MRKTAGNKKLIALLSNHEDDIYCFRKEQIEAFCSQGYEILVSCPYGRKLEMMNIRFKYVDTYIDRRGTSMVRDMKLFIHYLKLLKMYKPDIVLTYTVKPNVYGSIAAAWMRIPYINNVTGLGSLINKTGILKKFIMLLLKTAFRKSSCIFFQNQENMNLAKEQKLICGQVKLIPGSGVNTLKFALEPYPMDADTIIFNYIGRVMKDKGVDDYLRAAEIIKSKYENTEFNIIGFIEPTEIHYSDKLKRLQKLGIVNYLGNQDEVRPFIWRSHCTIHPSVYGEGMSNVLLESASCGRPVITTDIAGCREIVDEGVTGFIYRAGSTDELVQRIEAFLALDDATRKRMGEQGRAKMKDFSRDIVVNAYLDTISAVLNAENSHGSIWTHQLNKNDNLEGSL